MTIGDHQQQFHGKKVVQFRHGDAVNSLDSVVYRVGTEYDDELSLVDLLQEFLDKADLARLDALIIGMWADAYEESPQAVLDLLIERRQQLPALRALFVGDITFEECEISWIIQGSYKPLLDAFPLLEELRIRGSSSLVIDPFNHAHLRRLTVETGGLPSAIVNNLAQSQMPALQYLELWLGSDNYGFDGTVADYEALLNAIDPARLSYLGLRDSEITDKLAQWLAGKEWLAGLDMLDLSLGTLGDAGAEALYNSPYLRSLQRLDVSHHYMSAAWMEMLQSLPFEVKATDQQEEDDGCRYIAVAE